MNLAVYLSSQAEALPRRFLGSVFSRYKNGTNLNGFIKSHSLVIPFR
jgi:hypothetical protein